MTTEDQWKLRFYVNRAAAKISALSLGKINTYEYLTGEEILPANQKIIIEQFKFIFSPLGKLLKNKQKHFKITKETSWCFKDFKTKRTKSNWRQIWWQWKAFKIHWSF